MASTQQQKFIDLLKEIFQFDQADLDFGIYRIMNQKREEIDNFLNNELVPQVKSAFKKYKDADVEEVKQQIKDLEKQLNDMGVAKESSEKYLTLNEKLHQSVDISALENEVFSDLTNFFRRYYHEGDFLSLRRYKKDVYAIPYEGEEVKLHWANADQYYVKTSEYFRDYSFKLPSGKTVHFKLVDASTKENNNKEQEDKECRFILYKEKPLNEINGELYIYFEYKTPDRKQDQNKFNTETEECIFNATGYEQWQEELQILSPTEKSKKRTLLKKYLTDYTTRNTYDYFIHKDLGGFLRRELDFFIKNEIMHLDDLDTENEKRFEQYLSKVKVIKNIGHKIIAFVEQIENFQKKLWLKKKFVVQANYCITLDMVPKELYKDIIGNEEQIEEWNKLFSLKELSRYSEPLTSDFIMDNPFLVLDTKFFSDEFKDYLLNSIKNIDGTIDGLLMHGENFQALNLIEGRYKEQIQSVYIDPPYNTSASEILYKNSFKHSSWMSLLESRLKIGKSLLKEDGIFCVTIDDFEYHRLTHLIEEIFGPNNILGKVAIRNNPSGRSTAQGFSIAHEYGIFISKSVFAKVGRLKRNEKQQARYSEYDEKGNFEWVNFRKHGGTRNESPKMYYPFYLTDTTLRIPHMKWNEGEREWEVLEKPQKNETVIFPIDENQQQRRWKWSVERCLDNLDEFSVKRDKNKNLAIYVKARMNNEGVLPSTWWERKDYSATSNGTNLMKKLFGELNSFTYPKSIFAVEDSLRVTSLSEGDTVIDFFAGSGTTGHATINLNREDGGNRKYLLVEMGDYFHTVTKPRIQKVIYSKDWRNGKPVSRDGISHMFKYIEIESYEDTLNNIELQRTSKQQEAMDNAMSIDTKEEYLLSYMLDVESEDSSSLLNIDAFNNPFDYKMLIQNGMETKKTRIDLVETFNYLIGLYVKTINTFRGIKVITGTLRTGEESLIIWRNIDEISNEKLESFFEEQEYNTKDTEFDRIYVNGDNHLENLKTDEDKWKVVLIEGEFKRLMFDVQDV